MTSPPSIVSVDERRALDLDAVTVAEVMHPGVVSCGQGASPTDIAHVMSSCRVHCVAVVGSSDDAGPQPRIWGIVSDLDLLRAATEPDGATTAADLAHQPVISVRPTMPLREAAEAMVRYGAHHVVVTDPDLHAPVGILSTLDVIEVLERVRSQPRT